MERVHYTKFLPGSIHTLLERIIVTERTFVAALQHRKAVLGVWRQWPSLFYWFYFFVCLFFFFAALKLNFTVAIKCVV